MLADSDGYAKALRLVEEHAPARRAFAIEGTGSYGLGLTRFLTGRASGFTFITSTLRSGSPGFRNTNMSVMSCSAIA